MIFLATETPHVSLVAEPLFQIGRFTINNSSALGIVGTIVVFAIAFYTARRVSQGKYNRLSTAFFWVFEIMLNTIEEVLGDRAKARKLAPLAISIFFFVMINNWLEILPVVGPVTYHDMPLFRGLAADLNFTAALAVITMVTAQIWAIRNYGIRGNIGRYLVSPLKSPMHSFEGLLELVAEFSRLLALAMRLFGNIFGGEVLLLVMASITSYASPVVLPVLMLFELFIGVIQAYVFFMLTVVFVSLGTRPHEEASHEAGKPVTV